MSVVCVTAVRMGSSRLPGKTLAEADGRPLLGYLVDRIMAAKQIDILVVATSSLAEDDPIELFCKENEIACFRGSQDNVLDRITCAFLAHDAEVGVIVYGDGPLIDPLIIDHATKLYQSSESFEFVANDLITTFPAGMEVEVLSVDALCRARSLCTDDRISEHGTLFLRQHPNLFQLHNFEAEGTLRRPDLSLEVDTEEDFYVFERVVRHLNRLESFSLDEIIMFVDDNNLKKINEHIPRRWKQYRLKHEN